MTACLTVVLRVVAVASSARVSPVSDACGVVRTEYGQKTGPGSKKYSELKQKNAVRMVTPEQLQEAYDT